MTRPYAAKARLLAVLRKPIPAMTEKLRELKTRAQARAESPTFVWESLVQSFATMGNSRGWAGLVENEENARRVSYEVEARDVLRGRCGRRRRVVRRQLRRVFGAPPDGMHVIEATEAVLRGLAHDGVVEIAD